MTAKESRTAAATRARMRASEEKHAALLRARGWICAAPGTLFAERIAEVLAHHDNTLPGR